MATTATTGIPVRHLFAFLFTPMKMPFVKPLRRDTPPMTFGEDVAIRMSQRTLFLILGTVVAAVLAWTNLKSDALRNHEAILELTSLRQLDLVDRKADRDVLANVQKGIEALQRRAEWQDRKEGRTPTTVTTTTTHP